MKKEKQKEELQSRREFFKKAAKGALPVISFIALSTLSIPIKAAKTTDCEKACVASCGAACTSCWTGCTGTCKGCRGTCEGGCRGCTGGCSGDCEGGCSGCRGGCKTGCGYMAKGKGW